MIKELIYDRANRRIRFINISLNLINIFKRNVKPGEKNENNININNSD